MNNADFVNVTNELFQLLGSPYGLQAIVDYASVVFNKNLVTVIDGCSRILVHSSLENIQDPVLVNNIMNGYLSEDTYKQLLNDKIFERLYGGCNAFYITKEGDEKRGVASAPYGWINAPVMIKNTFLATFTICGNYRPLPEHYQELVDIFVKAVSIELQKNNFLAENKGMAYEIFFHDVLDGRYDDSDVVLKRFKLFGVNLKEKLYVVTCRKNKPEDKAIMQAVKQREIKKFFENGVSIVYKDDIVLLLSCTREENVNLAENDSFKSFVQCNDMSVGISNSFIDCSLIAYHYNQSLRALELARFDDNPWIHRYGNLAVYYSLSKMEKDDLVSMCLPYLYELYRKNTQSSNNSLETLELYLKYMKNVHELSEKMHLHRNTIFYRINKICDRIGLDLNNGTDVYNVMNSLKVINYLKYKDK